MDTGAPDIGFRPTLPVLLHRAVELHGGADFVVLRDRRLSFAEAERKSAVLAQRFLSAGVGKGTRIGIFLPTGVDWVLTWLAAARIGAMPMLFPATYRPPELARALRIGDVAHLVTTAEFLGKDHEAFVEAALPRLSGVHGALREPNAPYLRSVWMVGGSTRPWATPLELDDNAPADVSAELLEAVEAEVSPADPLLVIYTSGSSADPKAVVHTHGGAIRKMPPELGIALAGSFGGRTFCAMPFFWVGGPQDLLGALFSGAAVVAQERFDAGGALELLERERCTSIVGWPSLMDDLRAHPDFPERDLSALQFPERNTADWISSRGDPVNMGMTETFGPHKNRQWFDYKVVDPETGEAVPEGEIGEFCVRGFGLMAGLYKREREETFDVDGYYHTGDRGYLEREKIWFLGRYSEMVKSGGANVAPLEVEDVLQSFPEVREAFVLGVPDGARGDAVAAAVVPSNGGTVDVDELRRRTNEQLSAYKVPRRWLVMQPDEVPRLASGKVDKRSLRERFG